MPARIRLGNDICELDELAPPAEQWTCATNALLQKTLRDAEEALRDLESFGGEPDKEFARAVRMVEELGVMEDEVLTEPREQGVDEEGRDY